MVRRTRLDWFWLVLALGQLISPVITKADDPGDDAAKPGKFRNLVAKVERSIVRIVVPDVGSGSGFLLDDNGTVVTNYHVVEGAKQAKVWFADKSSLDVEGFLALSIGKDLALLRVNLGQGKIPPLPLARSRPEKGDEVLAFGAPRGLTGSVTDGIISAVRTGQEVRDVLLESTGRDMYVEPLAYDLDMTWLQSSAPISAGNSGGPLVDADGEVVGISTWTRTDGQNLNFAVAAEHVATLLKSAAEKPKALTELPKPRAKAQAAGGERTLDYWKGIIEANLLLGKRLNKAEHLLLRSYAKALKKLDIRDVDSELVTLALIDIQNCERMADAVERYATNKDEEDRDAALATYSSCSEKKTIINDEFDFQRVELERRYNLHFPLLDLSAEGAAVRRDAKAARTKAKSADAKVKPADANAKPADAKVQQAKRAASRLALAKQLLAADKPAGARKLLERIVKEHPDTEGGKEAAVLLEKLGEE